MGGPSRCWSSITTTTTTALQPALVVVVAAAVVCVLLGSGTQAATFKCTTNTTSTKCRALVDYVSPNKTDLLSIKSLFSLKNLRALLGANGLAPSTQSNYTVSASQTLKIPFRCTCTANSTGVSDDTPFYTVQSGDTLDNIAREVFGGLVTYQEIAAANNISDPNNIDAGQKLLIPLPCSCDEVGGLKVVHYGLVVESGASLQGIAEEYGTQEATLMSLNEIANASSLQAGQVIDVPLPACNSSVQSDSVDYPLLVSNGTYVYTAYGCVTCNCDSANNWTLQCKPSGLQPSSNWSTCPSMKCAGAENLYLSNTTTSSCNSSTCSYAGFYSNDTILTTLVPKSTCSASSSSSGKNAPMMSGSWIFLLICFHLVILFVHFL